MENFDLWPQLVALGQVIAIDLVLAGDNAIVVGMAAATVPLEQRRKVIFWGIGAAIALRIFFALMPSRPGEFHPEPLTEPDLSLSTYPARATP